MPEAVIKNVTARVDPELAWAAKANALSQRISFNEWICRALEEKLARSKGEALSAAVP